MGHVNKRLGVGDAVGTYINDVTVPQEAAPGSTSQNLAAPRCFGKGTCLARRAVRDAGALAVGVVGAGRDAPASARYHSMSAEGTLPTIE